MKEWAYIIGLSFGVWSSLALEIEIVSRPHTAAPLSVGDSTGIQLSGDGRWAMFTSSGNGLVTNSVREVEEFFQLDVYVKDTQSGAVTLVSRNPAGAPGNADSVGGDISEDGRWVVFESGASDLVSGDTNESADIFLYDRHDGVLQKITSDLGSLGGAILQSTGASITRDGRYVTFQGQIDALPNYFVYDRQTGETRFLILDPTGEPRGGVTSASMSEDGRWVAYTSEESLEGDPILEQGVFLYDVAGATNYWLSDTGTTNLARVHGDPLISQDGSTVAFVATDLQAATNSGPEWLHLYSTADCSLRRVPLPTEIRLEDFVRVHSFSLSADGRSVAYLLQHRIPSATNESFTLGAQVYLYDAAANSNRLVTVGLSGALGDGETLTPVISENGSRIVFTSTGVTLVEGVTNEFAQLYSYDRSSNVLSVISTRADGTVANADVIDPVLSGNGNWAGFETLATSLDGRDDPNGNDVFMAATGSQGSAIWVSSPADGTPSSSGAGASRVARQPLSFYPLPNRGLSLDGRWVLFTSTADNLVENDPNDGVDIFLRNMHSGETKLVTDSFDREVAGVSAQMSVDGKVVVFPSTTNAPPGAERIPGVLYRYETETGRLSPASVLPDGTVSTTIESFSALSANGRYLLFRHREGGTYQAILRDFQTQTSRLISESGSVDLRISSGGGFVSVYRAGAFEVNDGQVTILSEIPNNSYLNDSALDDSILVFSGSLGTIRVFSTSEDRVLFSTNASSAIVSGDGSTVAFAIGVQADGQTRTEARIYEVASGRIVAVPNDTGIPANSMLPTSISVDGRFILLGVDPVDDEQYHRVYVYDRVLERFTLVNRNRSGEPSGLPAGGASISGDGRRVVFHSMADNLVANDRNMNVDVFLATLDVVDSDADGLEDGWEVRNFAGLGSTGATDADGDGISNLEEFGAGTDPKNAGSKLEVSAHVTGTGVVLSWESVLGKVYQLQKRSVIGSGEWMNEGNPVTAVGIQTERYLAANGTSFFRVRVVE